MIKTKLKEYRARYNMNQSDLAKKVGVRRETIGHLERSEYSPSLKLAFDLARVFDTTVDELFYYVEDE